MLRRLYTVEITSSKLERLSLLSGAEEFDMASYVERATPAQASLALAFGTKNYLD